MSLGIHYQQSGRTQPTLLHLSAVPSLLKFLDRREFPGSFLAEAKDRGAFGNAPAPNWAEGTQFGVGSISVLTSKPLFGFRSVDVGGYIPVKRTKVGDESILHGHDLYHWQVLR